MEREPMTIKFLFNFEKNLGMEHMVYHSIPYDNNPFFNGFHRYACLDAIKLWNHAHMHPHGFYVDLDTGKMAGPGTNEGRLMKLRMIAENG